MRDTPGELGRIPALLTLLITVGAVGCTVEDAGPRSSAAETEGASESETVERAGESGTWKETTASGVEVTLRTAEAEPRGIPAGTLRFEVEMDVSDEVPVTVDVVSPEMPMHGIRRFPARRKAKGVWEVDAELPMEGAWMLYVNLDASGADAAEFPLDVLPSPQGEGHDHGGMGGP